MKMRLCEIVQQLEYVNMDIVKGALDSKKGIRDYAYIIHDKDVAVQAGHHPSQPVASA